MRFRTGAPLLALGGLLVGHGWLCSTFLCDYPSRVNRLPFLSADHTLHFASAVTTREFLRDSGLNAGFDPALLGGYVKSTYWPTNAQLELAMWAAGGAVEPAWIYKFFVWASAAALPMFVVFSAFLFGRSLAVATLAAGFWCAAYWSRYPFQTFDYIMFGMSAFVWSVGWTLLAGAALTRWLRVGGLRAAFGAGLAVGLAAMAHPTAVVLLGPPALLAWLLGEPVWRGFREAILLSVVAVAINYWWLIPLWTFSDTLGSSPAFFVNPNVLERLVDLVRPVPEHRWLPGPNVVTMLLAFGLLSGTRLGWLPLVGVGWIFLLSIPAGALASLSSLQLGRNTLHLIAWLCVPAADFVLRHAASGSIRPRAAMLAACAWIAAAAGPQLAANVASTVRNSPIATSARLPAHFPPAFERIRAATPPGQRVLFEVFEGRNAAVADDKNPHELLRLAPLVPSYTGREAIGGPYLSTHYRENFANCGDGEFLGKAWTRERFLAHAGVYALGSAVLWSRPALQFARENSDLFEPLPGKTFQIFRIKRPPEPWEAAGLEIVAAPNRLTIRNPRGARGTFVLPYHFRRGWTATPACQLSGALRGEDPTPFLTIADPPPTLELRFSPWTALGEKLGLR